MIGKIRGSQFLETLAKCIRDGYKTTSFEDMFLMVTDAVAEQLYKVRVRGQIQDYMQIPQKVSTLRRALYFTEHPVNQVRKWNAITEKVANSKKLLTLSSSMR